MKCLNLGSFVDVVDGWINLDILPLERRLKDYWFVQHDLRKSMAGIRTWYYGEHWDGSDNSIDLIRASHVIEHIGLEDAHYMLSECHRVMKPGAIVRVITPDLDVIVQKYIKGDMAFFDSIQPEEYIKASTPGEKVSRLLFSGDYAHRAIYNERMLTDFLKQAGFDRVIRCRPNISLTPHMPQDDHIPISIMVEAVK